MTVVTARHRDYSPQSAARAGHAQTPYVRARREWDARMGSAVVQAKNWRLAAAGLGVLLTGSLAGNIWLGRQPKLVPHVIEVDALGEVAYRGPAGQAAFTPNEGLVRHQLRRFIDHSRTITSDKVLLKKNWIAVYKMLTPTGSTLMTEWVRTSDPFVRAQTETAAIEILSAVPLSAESWQIDWRETTWDTYGQLRGKPMVWRAMLKITMMPPTTREQMVDNPLGLFVDEFHWDRVQAAKP